MFCGYGKTFDREPRKLIEQSMQQRGLPEMLVKAVVSLYERATTNSGQIRIIKENFC